MSELNENWRETARNNLSTLLHAVPSQQQVADLADVSKSTVNRDLQTALENNLFNYIAIAGLKLVPAESVEIDPKEHQAYKVLAKKLLEQG